MIDPTAIVCWVAVTRLISLARPNAQKILAGLDVSGAVTAEHRCPLSGPGGSGA